MRKKLKKDSLERYSRQIILKDIGIIGQKKIINSKVLIVGGGGLGCPVADLLARSGIGLIGVIDFDKVSLSNIHRQTLYTAKDIGKFKVNIIKKRLNLINKEVKVKIYNKKADDKNLKNIINKYDVVVDGSDNFKTKFLLNESSIKNKKKLVVGAISRFDGHIFVFNFNNNKSACLKCFYQEKPSDDILNCDQEGILGTTATILGSFQANEIIKLIIGSKNNLNNSILILNTLNLNQRIVKFKKIKKCVCDL